MTTPVAGVSIRPAQEDDLEAINRIYNYEIEHGTATWDIEPWSIERRREWWAARADPLQPVIVAEREGRVIGFAYLTYVSQKYGWRFTREDTIYIDESFRGQGIGRMLLTAILETAREIGARSIMASITSTNETSIRLHQQFGFEVMGSWPNAGFKFGEWLGTTYLLLDLGEPPRDKSTW